MKNRSHSLWLLLASGVLLVGLAIPWPGLAGGRIDCDRKGVATDDGSERVVEGKPMESEVGVALPPKADKVPTLGDLRFDPSSGKYRAPLGTRTATLTLEPRLQAALEKTLRDYRVPWG